MRLSHGRMTPSKRIDLVEAALRAGPWDESIVKDLTAKTGATRATIYRDRAAALERIRIEEIGTRETRRTKFLLSLSRDIESARADKKWAAVATFQNLQSKILGLDVPPMEPESPESDIGNPDELLSHLTELRSMLREARSRGSMVAAASLAEQVRSVLSDLRARDEAEKARNQAVSSDSEILASIGSAIADLPEALVDQIEQAIRARRNPVLLTHDTEPESDR